MASLTNRLNLLFIMLRPKFKLLAATTLIMLSAMLIFRNTGLYPTVFADEYTYSKFARLLPLDQVAIPGYLYLSVYSLTTFCGDGFLNCARLLNVIFFVAAAPFIYLIGVKLSSRRSAALIAGLALISPLSTYTAYFMPESLYFLSFWVFTYLLLKLNRESSLWSWLLLGAAFGVSALIKPHALFLSPAILIYLLLVQFQAIDGKFRNFNYSQFFGFLGSTIATKFIIGFFFAGNAGLTIFGSTYSSIASDALSITRILNLLKPAFESFQGHIYALTLLFSVSVAQLMVNLINIRSNKADSQLALNFSVYTALVFFCLIGVVTLFTASIAGSGPYESTARLHMRYYNFAFPLLLLVAAFQLTSLEKNSSLKQRLCIGIPTALLIIYLLSTEMRPYTPNFVDSPELRGFTSNIYGFYILGFGSLLSILSWIASARKGLRAYLFCFIPLSVITYTIFVHKDLMQSLKPTVFDRAGLFTKQYLTREELSKVLVVGTEAGGLFKALFHLDNPTAAVEAIGTGMGFDVAKMPSGKEWILLIGGDVILKEPVFQVPLNGFSLIRVSNSVNLDFKKSSWPGVVSDAKGLSSPEPWGTWSNDHVIRIEFSRPLPRSFKLRIIASAFGPNVGEAFVVEIGDQKVEFTLTEKKAEVQLDFDDVNQSNALKINVPSPTSPHAVGLGEDKRKLGIGLAQISVIAK